MYSIDSSRFIKSMEELGKIGWQENTGLQRSAYSDFYYAARDWLDAKMRELGLETHVDRVGNLFGVLRGATDNIILSGSHLDSVTNGGIYDGSLGIIAALESVASLREAGYKPQNTFVVAAFIAEEGEPLGGTFGSRAFAGLIDPVSIDEVKLSHYGIDKEGIAASRGDLEKMKAYIELHIEQGPVLERSNIPIGVPTGIVGITRYDVSIYGVANHAGTTPMSERKDAVRIASDIIHEWYKWMDAHSGLVCNIGTMTVLPGHVSIVPDKVSFCLELRSLDESLIREAASAFHAIVTSHLECCAADLKLMGSKPPVLLDNDIVETVGAACGESDIKYIKMPSGASHDASPIAHVMPCGMIFVQSRNGVSHSKDEYTSNAAMICGANILMRSLLALDKVY